MKKLIDQVEELSGEAVKNLSGAQNLDEVVRIKIASLGKKGSLTSMFAHLANLDQTEKIALGKALNTAKNKINECVLSAEARLSPELDKLSKEDLSKPGIPLGSVFGHAHPTSLILEQTYQVFTELGFAIVDGPEIELDWYNFEVLNQPPEHPARDMQDTFYILDEKNSRQHLPRTQTSAMQVRFMEANKPPFKIIVPGKVFRNEDEDRTHSWSFYQIEGMVVGESISLADLKGTMMAIVEKMLGEHAEVRLRPSYFPYTEPSIEVDAKMGDEWLELGGAGMVHPEVLKKGGIDPERYSGFAFGWGAERIAVIKYGLTDLRKLWRPNLYFLEQF